ncbi:MAG: CotH kinase family protein [Lachnospiraceae bacterium]|nr:CotH kinase family protein [Lachnospiraceae bacterium]
MMQFIAGVILILVPGMLPAYVRYQRDKKGNRFSAVTDTLLFAFLILVCTGGVTTLLFGDMKLSLKNNPYLLLYVVWLVTAYGLAFMLAILVLEKKKGAADIRPALFFCTALWAVLIAGVCYDDYAAGHVVINEVCAHNLSLALDGDGNDSDYIELYNPSFTSVPLGGWHLTDGVDGKEGHGLPEMMLPPRSYLLLFADGSGRGLVEYEDDEEEIGSAVYLDFKLREQGETLTLADSTGRMIDRVEVPALSADVSYARLSGQWNIVKNGTPGEGNEGLKSCVLPTLDAPVFSAGSGFYEEPFSLSLTAKAGETIYYTTDGKLPTGDSTKYTEPISIVDASGTENVYAAITGISEEGDYQPADRIDKGTLVRAVCVNEAGEVSQVSSQIYFVGYEENAAYDQMKVMSIEAEPEDFFSEDRGIYMLGRDYQKWEEYRRDMGHSFEANYTHPDRTKERRVKITMFDEDKKPMGEEEIGVRIRGGSSRNMRQKGFNFYVRDEYGEDVLGLGAKMLRTSGSIDTNVTMLRDVFNQSLVAGENLDTQPGEPCMVFLNGEFWGLYNLQARYGEAYYKERYGIEEDNLIVIKREKHVSVGEEEDLALYRELLDYAQANDLSQPECYETIGQMMDIQSFIEQYCFEIYIGNSDWPLNNVCCWRTRTTEEDGDHPYADGRWRWGVYDTDESTGIYKDGMCTYDSNPFTEEAHWAGSPFTTVLMSRLLVNESFRDQFEQTFYGMINKNFAYPQVHDKLYEMAARYEEPMVKSWHRFNDGTYTADTFWENIAVLDEFYQKRADYVIPYFEEAMSGIGAE